MAPPVELYLQRSLTHTGWFCSGLDSLCLCFCLRSVVDLVTMLPNFIEKLEEMVTSLHCSSTAGERLAQLVSHMMPP